MSSRSAVCSVSTIFARHATAAARRSDMARSRRYIARASLLPLFRVDVRPHARRLAREAGIPLERAIGQVAVATRLGDHLAAGTLHDPRRERFVPWDRYTLPGTGRRTSVFLYSRYQLLLAPLLKVLTGRMRAHGRSLVDMRYMLKLSDGDDGVREATEKNSALVVALSAIEARYLPEIPDETRLHLRGALANSDLAYREHFAVGRMFARIGWEADRLRDTARQLLREARHLEPYDDWYKALRLYDPDIWEALRGDTLVALDRRIASELLLRFHDDLIITGLIPQGVLPGRMDEPHRERLKTDRSELDEVLMDVGLSPHPSLVLALEGETEMIIVPRLMRLLGVKDAPDFIRLFQYGGVEQSFHLLVRYVVAPALGDRLGDPAGDLYPFTRPPAKIMVTADPEGQQLRTEDDRASWRGARLRAIIEELPRDLRGADSVERDLEEYVTIYAWDESFEFANFSSDELASALRVPIADIHWLRTTIGRFELQHLWGRLRSSGFPLPSPRPPSKAMLAEERLWPVLERRIAAAHAQGRDIEREAPVVTMIMEAWRLAASTKRRNVALFVPEGDALSGGPSAP